MEPIRVLLNQTEFLTALGEFCLDKHGLGDNYTADVNTMVVIENGQVVQARVELSNIEKKQ